MSRTSNKPLAIFLMGPTASGKTALAMHLVRELACEIISVDSAMVYRGMDIGTAKPSAEELRRAPHRLIDIIDPVESYSAAQFREDALREMQSITAAGKVPLLVGGTMLYFRALQMGLSPLPSADAEIRDQIEQQARERGWPALHEKLTRLDPASASRIHPHDPQRIQRALEVYEITGRSLSEHFQQNLAEPFPYRVIKIILGAEDRSLLHRRISDRFHGMLEQGLVSEVEGLYARGDLHENLPSMRTVGYRQVLKYLHGDYTYSDMLERGIIATRQLAKRQMTWLRAESNGHWFAVNDLNIDSKVLNLLRDSGAM